MSSTNVGAESIAVKMVDKTILPPGLHILVSQMDIKEGKGI